MEICAICNRSKDVKLRMDFVVTRDAGRFDPKVDDSTYTKHHVFCDECAHAYNGWFTREKRYWELEPPPGGYLVVKIEPCFPKKKP